MDSPDNKTDDPSQSAALQTAQSILRLGQRSEEEILQAKQALERRTEELAHSLSMMRATLESTTDAIVVTDEEGMMTGFNEKYIEMLGIPRDLIESADAQELREIFSRQFKDPQKFLARVQEIYVNAPPETFDLLEFADGRVFERYSKIQTIENRRVGRVWSFRDITERKRAEERLRAAKIAAETASKAKDDFLAVLSHELRTPLTPALAAASYLAEHENLLPEFREEVTAIWRNVQLEARLIDDLLDVTRITRGKIELRREAVDAHGLLRNAVKIAHKDMLEKEIELVLDFHATAFHVWADPVRIQQVFWNVLNNAVKFSSKGGRIVLRSFNDDGKFALEITDAGIGIELEQQERIFQAFEQAEPSITRQFGGLGLGLTICKRLMDIHGGEITVESPGKNQGTTFRMRLDTAAPPATRSTDSSQTDAGSDRTLRVLMVDDDVDTRLILSRLLGKAGHDVVPVESVHGALKLLDSEQFDVLISDIGLPDSSGYELVREAKKRQPLKGIALSGFGAEEDLRRSMEAGFDYHLTKPVNFQDLLSVLRKVAS
jgi:PAS domain S-box-containing protein